MLGTLLLSSSINLYTNTNFLAIIPIYGGVLSTIEKVLLDFVEEYQGIRKFLWNLVEN